MLREREILVVKAGSSSVSDHELGLNIDFIDSMARQLSFLWFSGKQVILVSSGAVAAGRQRRTMHPTRSRFNIVGQENLADKQVSAIFGQPALIGEYVRAFDKYGVLAGQVLLTGDDLEKRRIGPLLGSLYVGVPIINANDPLNAVEMAQYEKARDNDKLAGELAESVNARKLIMLTDQPGVLDIFNNNQLIPSITSQEEYEKAMEMVKSWNRWKESTGGMTSKLEVVWRFASQGRVAWIANASDEDIILRIMQEEQVGTKIWQV